MLIERALHFPERGLFLSFNLCVGAASRRCSEGRAPASLVNSHPAPEGLGPKTLPPGQAAALVSHRAGHGDEEGHLDYLSTVNSVKGDFRFQENVSLMLRECLENESWQTTSPHL